MLVLVLTDVEGSTRLWQDEPDAMDVAMRRHHQILHAAINDHGGWRPADQGEGDAVFAAFSAPAAAVAAVVQAQRELASEAWPTSLPLRVRMGLHVGEVLRRDGNLFGEPVSRCARLRGLASGGQTLLSATLLELVRDELPTGTSVVDLGQHRMKDLTHPERVHQLDISGLPTSFPPLCSLDRATHNLPVQATPFIGRERELAALVATVRAHRLVTLTGFGGMGKTRLALQAAAEVTADDEIGDVWFVDLAAVTDPALVPARLAESAGVRFGTGDPAEALVLAFAERPTLLVLDNLEQVLGCAPFVAELVAAVPTLRVLATSREPLHVRSERQVPLAPMAVPAEAATAPVTAEALSAYEAVRFFVDRACAVRPNFAITKDTAPAVAAICVRLDGHPLALELAASRVKMLTPDMLLARLDSALAVLTGGSRDMPERHQTLRATIAWSFDALSTDEQALLSRMSVLPAPADLELVEAVCGEGLDAFGLLETLVERSLVRTSEVEGGTRFGLLVSVRDFAAEHLDAAAAKDLRDRHAAHVAAVFQRPRSTFADIDLVNRELTHLRAAMSHLRQAGAHAAEVALLISTDDGLLHSGHLAEVLNLCDRALGMTDDPQQRAHLYCLQGMGFEDAGQVHDYRRAFKAGLLEARRCGDPALHANVLVIAVSGTRTRAELDELVEEYAGLRLQLTDEWRTAMDEEEANVLAAVLRYRDPLAAEEAARRFIGAPMDGVHRVRLARVLFDTGRSAEAWETLAPVQDPGCFQGVRVWELHGLTELARAHLVRGDSGTALKLATEALEGQVAIGATRHEAAMVLARLERREGRAADAVAVLDQALGAVSGPPGPQSSQLLWRRALAHHDLGRAERAAADIAVAREVLADEELYLLELLGCLAAEAVVVAQSDPAKAARLLGCVQASRGGWVLPFDLDEDAAALAERLSSTHGDELVHGRTLTPAFAAHA